MENERWQAEWIWYPKARKTVNFHFFARKAFELKGGVKDANLHIFAFSDYKLYVNGKYLGRGPVPSDPYNFQYYDTHAVGKHLKKGKNVIGIICHNYGVGTHWQLVAPGGLIVQLDMETKAGKRNIISDKSWKVKEAECWAGNSPRMFWSCGFTETFDFRKYDEDWLDADYDDSGWVEPETHGKTPVNFKVNLISREIPFLREEPQKPAGIEKGEFDLKGFHAISFDGIIPAGENRIGYAQTYFYSDTARELTLRLSSDDAFKALLNGKMVLEQGYSEGFARTRRWYGKDDYEQHHYGFGAGSETAKVKLLKGWNKLLVAIDQGPGGWGFSMSFMDSAGKPENIPFSNVKDLQKREWILAGPLESTGMNNSLAKIVADVAEVPANAKVVNYSPFDYGKVTDYSRLMQAEKRKNIRRQSGKQELVLNEGEFGLVDFGEVKVGYPQLEFEASEEAVVDVGYCSVLSEDKNIIFLCNPVKYVDRVYLRNGESSWEPLQRRTGRYFHISCRAGKNVRIKGIGIKFVSYPVREVAGFASSDGLLNRIWDISRYTTKLLMQYGYQDCLRREEGTCNMSSFNYMSRSAGYCFGDYLLARKTLKMAAMTQNDTGWFDSHGISSPNSDEQNECLWWVVWLKDYYMYSGDLGLVRELYETVGNNIRYFSKMMNLHGLPDSRNEFIIWRGQTVYIDDSLNGFPEYRGLIFDGEVFGYSILYYAALKAAGVMARELGYAEDAEFYEKKAARVKVSCNERFWDDKKGLYVDFRRGKKLSDRHSQALQIGALYFDLCDEEKGKKVFDYFAKELSGRDFTKLHMTFGFYYYLMEILFRRGKGELALDLMRAYYGKWLAMGGTTMGEYFDLSDYEGREKLFLEYEVHGYGTSAHLHFYTNILGVVPQKPGFKAVLFQPCPGGLKRAKGRVHTPQGEIAVSWQAAGPIFSMEVKLPKICEYSIVKPLGFREYRIKVNDKVL